MAVAIYFAGVCIVVLVMLSSYFLGSQSHNRGKNFPYESGIKSFGSSRVRFFLHYFLVAILFVIFDVESVFLYIWSSSIRAIGGIGFFQVLFFVGMILLGLVYAFSMGVLTFFPKPSKVRDSYERTTYQNASRMGGASSSA